MKLISKRTFKFLCVQSFVQGESKKEINDFDEWLEERWNDLKEFEKRSVKK